MHLKTVKKGGKNKKSPDFSELSAFCWRSGRDLKITTQKALYQRVKQVHKTWVSKNQSKFTKAQKNKTLQSIDIQQLNKKSKFV